MTLDQLQYILTSRPRLRVVRVVILWLVAIILTIAKWIVYLPALPFLIIADALYDAKRLIAEDVGDIRNEIEETKLRNQYEKEKEGEADE